MNLSKSKKRFNLVKTFETDRLAWYKETNVSWAKRCVEEKMCAICFHFEAHTSWHLIVFACSKWQTATFFPQCWKTLQQSVRIRSAKTPSSKIWAKAFSIMSVVLLSPSVTQILDDTHSTRTQDWGQAAETKPSIPIWWVTQVHTCMHAHPKSPHLGIASVASAQNNKPGRHKKKKERRWNQNNLYEQSPEWPERGVVAGF